MKNPKRTALLIHCSLEEAGKIRAIARGEHRTISGYVLAVLTRHWAFQERVRQEHDAMLRKAGFVVPEKKPL